MPFPFLPAGAVLAATVLVAALSVFGLVLRAMDRAIVGLRDTVVSGLVSGLRTWNTAHPERLATVSPGALTSSPWSAPGTRPFAPPAAPTPQAKAVPFEADSDAFPPAEVIDLPTSPIEGEPVAHR